MVFLLSTQRKRTAIAILLVQIIFVFCLFVPVKLEKWLAGYVPLSDHRIFEPIRRRPAGGWGPEVYGSQGVSAAGCRRMVTLALLRPL